MARGNDWVPWVIGGGLALAGGAVLLKNVLGPSPKCILTVYGKLESDWGQYLDPFHAVSIKVCDGRQLFQTKPAKYWPTIDAAGCKRWAWGGNYCMDLDRAVQEADIVVRAYEKWGGFEAYCMDAETTAFYKSAPDPPIAVRFEAFLSRLRDQLPELKIVYNGYSYADWYKPKDQAVRAGIRPIMVPELVDVFMPMVYRRCSNTAGCRQKIAASLTKHAAKFPLVPAWGPMTGTGRWSDTHEEAWGWWNDKGDAPGEITLARTLAPEYWAFWYGVGSMPQLSAGFSDGTASGTNPPLYEVAALMHQAAGGLS